MDGVTKVSVDCIHGKGNEECANGVDEGVDGLLESSGEASVWAD